MDKSVSLSEHTRPLSPLSIGQQVLIQDQDKASKSYKQWTKSGDIIIEVGLHNDYQIRVDGSRHVTKRNRQFLKPVREAPDVFSPPQPIVRPTDRSENLSPYLDSDWVGTDSTQVSAHDNRTHEDPQKPHEDTPIPTPIRPDPNMTVPVPRSHPTHSPDQPPIPKIRLHRNPDDGWALAPHHSVPSTVVPNIPTPIPVAPLHLVPSHGFVSSHSQTSQLDAGSWPSSLGSVVLCPPLQGIYYPNVQCAPHGPHFIGMQSASGPSLPGAMSHVASQSDHTAS